MKKLVHVAVGVIVDASGNILIARRAQTAHQGGLWEFPGGKVDAGETVQQALARELKEELAIDVTGSDPLIQIRHHYPDKSVLLDVHKVTQFSGVAKGNEGQPIAWVSVNNLSSYEFPAANQPIITAIRLPDKLLITGEFASLGMFNKKLSHALQSGIRLVQLRVDNFDVYQHKNLLDTALVLCETHHAVLMVNTSVDIFNSIQQLYQDKNIGLHLNRHQLLLHEARPIDTHFLLSASCHNSGEIKKAQDVGVDYLLLSPVAKTVSHPAASPLGWQQFSTLVENANVPVYALGGMGDDNLTEAKLAGAQGIAAISTWWK